MVGGLYISPVFKADDIGDPNNYRGITVTRRYGTYTSACGKSKVLICEIMGFARIF